MLSSRFLRSSKGNRFDAPSRSFERRNTSNSSADFFAGPDLSGLGTRSSVFPAIGPLRTRINAGHVSRQTTKQQPTAMRKRPSALFIWFHTARKLSSIRFSARAVGNGDPEGKKLTSSSPSAVIILSTPFRNRHLENSRDLLIFRPRSSAV